MYLKEKEICNKLEPMVDRKKLKNHISKNEKILTVVEWKDYHFLAVATVSDL